MHACGFKKNSMFVLSMGLVGLGNTWKEKLLKSMIQVCGVGFEHFRSCSK